MSGSIHDRLTHPDIRIDVDTCTDDDLIAKRDKLQELQDAFLRDFRKPTEAGDVLFDGEDWPTSKLYGYNMADAIAVARRDLVRAVLVANAAIATKDDEARELMTTWFGASGTDDVNWKVVRSNLRVLEYYVLCDIAFRYEPDKESYASTVPGKRDLLIKLGPKFFDVNKKNLQDKDSANIGYTVIHEMSHNVCRTRDHRNADGKKCYGEARAQRLAENSPLKACDCAACYQFFCAAASHK